MKKTIKKIITGILTACMVVSVSSITAFASDTVNLNENSSAGSTTVRYAIDSGWTATIPAYINPSEQGNADIEKYSVTVSDVMLGSSATLVGTVEYDGKLVEANDVELGYVLCDSDGEIVTNKEIIYADAGKPDATTSFSFGAELKEKPKYAGNYLGTATFSFAVNERVFTIGETNPENVIAKFNEDYSQVDIFTAGNDSDGIMKDFNGDSPMQEQSAKLEIASIESGVTTIGDQAFNTCNKLNSVTIPDTVTLISDNSFNECNSLNTVYGSYGSLAESWAEDNSYDFINTKVYTAEDIAKDEHLMAIGKTKPEYVVAQFNDDFTEVSIFANGLDSDGKIKDNCGICTSLKQATIKNGVTSIGYGLFRACKNLKSVAIPNSVISIDDYAFYQCSQLKNITIPNSVTSIGIYAFNSCLSLTNITIPDSVTYIGNSVFENCPNLTSVIISKSVNTIASDAFAGCKSLSSVTVPDSVTSIGSNAFNGCINLTEIMLPNSITTIGFNAFRNCSNLTSITIPNNITLIDGYTFYGCTNLTNITMFCNVTFIDSDAFKNCSNLSTVYGNSGSYAETFATENGYTFVAID